MARPWLLVSLRERSGWSVISKGSPEGAGKRRSNTLQHKRWPLVKFPG